MGCINAVATIDQDTYDTYNKDGTSTRHCTDKILLYRGQVHLSLVGITYLSSDVAAFADMLASLAWQAERLTHLVDHSNTVQTAVYASTELSEKSLATEELERTYDPQDEIPIPENELITDPTQEEPF